MKESQQIAPLNALTSLVQPETPVAPRPKWGTAPDLVLAVVQAMRQLRPSLVIECGSGWSTLWLALAAKRFELSGRVVALEHAAKYARITEELLEAHGAEAFADVRLAPLESMELDGRPWRWYSPAAWEDLARCSVLLVDGPPGKSNRHARFPAVPALASRLERRVVVALDDARRTGEREIVRAWQSMDLGLELLDTKLAKGAVVLYRGERPVL
jgi:hypothetical protein